MKKKIKNLPKIEESRISEKVLACLEIGKIALICLIGPFGLYNMFADNSEYYFRKRVF